MSTTKTNEWLAKLNYIKFEETERDIIFLIRKYRELATRALAKKNKKKLVENNLKLLFHPFQVFPRAY